VNTTSPRSFLPDGKFVAFQRARDIWVRDLDKGVTTRLTTDGSINFLPVWSPDGKRIAFNSNRDGILGNVYERAFGAVGEDTLLLKSDVHKNLGSWSRDGRYLFYVSCEPNRTIWALPLFGDRKPLVVTKTSFNQFIPKISPDGHWIAYVSDESRRLDVYIQSFPQSDIK
jgi:Tol biopolymer transport system component